MEELRAPAWAGYISPAGLQDLVWNTAPFLRDKAEAATEGYLTLLVRPVDDLSGYFALCLACHHATVATYVPTDVDTKIRGLLWRDTADRGTLRRMADQALEMHTWPLQGVSQRVVDCGEFGPVSGHDGEWLSVVAGAHGRFLSLGDEEYAQLTFTAIDGELRREAAAFDSLLRQPGRELDVMRLAMSITHNLGDLNQGISFWSGGARHSESASQFGRLAQENSGGYGGAFRRPGNLYRELLSTEGHRHYPLRSVKALRRSESLLLPLGPFFDEYGERVARSPLLDISEKAEVLEALVRGCRKVPGQSGYYRAIAGFREAPGRVFDDAVNGMAAGARKILREPDVQQRTNIARRSFESTYIKRVEQMRRSAQ